MVVDTNSIKNSQTEDDKALGDIAARNAPQDGLSDLERARRGLAKRVVEDDNAVVDSFQKEEAESTVSDASDDESDDKPDSKKKAAKKSSK